MSDSLETPWRPPGSPVHGILQARIQEWVVISFSRGSSRPRDWTPISCIGRQILYHWASWEAIHIPWRPYFEFWPFPRQAVCIIIGFLCGSAGKESPCHAGDLGSIHGWGRSPGGGYGNPLLYSCLENSSGQWSLVGYSPWDCRVGHNWVTKHIHSLMTLGSGVEQKPPAIYVITGVNNLHTYNHSVSI